MYLMNQLTANVRSQQWLQMIQDQKASGLTVRDWCREQHISENCFYYRQNKLRISAGDVLVNFVEITGPVKDEQLSQHIDNQNINCAASIASGKVLINLNNNASETGH